jgi:predicted dehydrogenase
VAVVGLGSFGLTFVPLYVKHPDVARVILCDPDATRLGQVARAFGITETRANLDEVLADPDIDAVHLITPMQIHASQSVAVLDAGKHCACAVPAAVSLDELHDLNAAEARSGRNYMMMETAVYTQEFLHAQRLLDSGELGRIQFLRGAHYSDYEAWPSWKWYPPMAYATHAVGPLLRLADAEAVSVRCLGSGVMPKTLAGPTGNPFPVETAIFEVDGGLAAEVTRSIFRMARQVQESFSVYGEQASFEWQQVAGELPVVFRLAAAEAGNEDFVQQRQSFGAMLGIDSAALDELVPASRFPAVTVESATFDEADAELPVELRGGAGHGGAEAHLVNEFVRSIVEGRPSSIGAAVAAAWTAPGLCAHESALLGGQPVAIPQFRADKAQLASAGG